VTGQLPSNTVYARRMVAAVLSGASATFITRLVGILTLPLTLHLLGLSLFGLWAIISVITNSQFLVDFGMASVTAKFVAQAEATGDRPAIIRSLAVGVGFYLILSVLVAALLLPLVGNVPTWFHLQSAAEHDARLLWLGGIGLFALSNLPIALSATLLGLHRWTAANAGIVASQVPLTITLILAEARGWGAAGVLGAMTAMYVAQTIWMAIAYARYLPSAVPNSIHHHIRFRTFLGFGSRVQLTTMADFFALQAPKIVVGVAAGSTAAARLDLAFRVPLAASAFLLPLLPPLIPAAARLATQPAQAAMAGLFDRATRYMLGGAGLIFTLVVFIGPDALAAWLGAPGSGLEWPIRLLAVALLLYTLPGVLISMATGAGRLRVVLQYKAVVVALSAALLVPLTHAAGVVGASAAVLASFAGGFAYLVISANQVLGAGARTVWARALGRTAAACTASLLSGVLAVVLLHAVGVNGAAWFGGVAVGLTYLGMSAMLKVLTVGELAELVRASPLRRLTSRLRG
jgi:O-antigen/teichoic acid export membrane protein